LRQADPIPLTAPGELGRSLGALALWVAVSPISVRLEFADAPLHQAVAKLVERAQATGKLQDDIVANDVPMLMCGSATAVAAVRAHSLGARLRRVLRVRSYRSGP
jgi:hypothetical protein